ncbi:unnamed protein product [Didymodactylos carnosus]|uniref:Uncharacterized protein n=1 Tax=Didymodactylos carnosus TaxID=1234261 RepID=A0A8S2WX88_9BILA|nr:unnamed protein product [Didymodactylos carnosus]
MFGRGHPPLRQNKHHIRNRDQTDNNESPLQILNVPLEEIKFKLPRNETGQLDFELLSKYYQDHNIDNYI